MPVVAGGKLSALFSSLLGKYLLMVFLCNSLLPKGEVRAGDGFRWESRLAAGDRLRPLWLVTGRSGDTGPARAVCRA